MPLRHCFCCTYSRIMVTINALRQLLRPRNTLLFVSILLLTFWATIELREPDSSDEPLVETSRFSQIKKTMAIHIKDIDELMNKLTEAGDKLVVIDFMATWCGNCKMIGPKLEEMANEMADSIVVLKVDVDECEDIAMEYNINSMPTFVFVKNSKKLEEFSGANVDKLKTTILKLK